MNDPICAVCGESKNSNLLMFNYGLCLCHRCTGIAAEVFIKEQAEKRLREAERKTRGLKDEKKESFKVNWDALKHPEKEETKEEYMERVDSEQRMKDFDALMKKLEDDRKVKAERDRIAAKRLQEIRDNAAKAAEAAIKFALGTHEALRERCNMCGKAVHPSLLVRVHGKYGGAPDKLCPDCLKEYKLKKAEEATQIQIADLSIENNRLRIKLKDLEKAHSDFSDRCFWVFWIMLGLGVAAGIIFSNIFK